MMQALRIAAGRFFERLGAWLGGRRPVTQERPVTPPAPPAPPAMTAMTAATPEPWRRLERIVLTDEVNRTLFRQYAEHRASDRGEDETGWVLLGRRQADHALALAALPAGAGSEAGVAHVRFHSAAQAIASRIVRRHDKRLSLIGVVHTHPGRLRQPSGGDFAGDRVWVEQLRGQEGAFGIGTADATPLDAAPLTGPQILQQPEPHRQWLGELCFSWYALAKGDAAYRPLPVQVTLGPDLARPLHHLWPVLERHAQCLERLSQLFAQVSLQVVDGDDGPAVGVTIGLGQPGQALRLVVESAGVRYYVVQDHDVFAVDPDEDVIDRGVFVVLAELGRRTDAQTATKL